jgi:hypothetical protein
MGARLGRGSPALNQSTDTNGSCQRAHTSWLLRNGVTSPSPEINSVPSAITIAKSSAYVILETWSVAGFGIGDEFQAIQVQGAAATFHQIRA